VETVNANANIQTMMSTATPARASFRLRARASARELRSGACKPASSRAVTLRRGAIVSEEYAVAGKSGAAYDEFASLLDKYQYNYKVGDVITGRVKACDAKGAWIEIGAKSEALCPTSEASLSSIRNVRGKLSRRVLTRGHVDRGSRMSRQSGADARASQIK